jgi:hypothetical protein
MQFTSQVNFAKEETTRLKEQNNILANEIQLLTKIDEDEIQKLKDQYESMIKPDSENIVPTSVRVIVVNPETTNLV